MATILSEHFSGELESYTRGLFRNIAKKTNLSLEQLIEYAFELDNVVIDRPACTSEIELEYLNINNIEYLFDSNSRYIYSYATRELLGKLNEYNEPIPVNTMEAKPTVSKKSRLSKQR
jgi:hypothetical protein